MLLNVFLSLGSLGLFALSLTATALASESWVRLDATGRALLAIALTPSAYGGVFVLATALAPGFNVVAFGVLLAAISVAVLAAAGPRLRQVRPNMNDWFPPDSACRFTLVGAVALVTLLGVKLAIYAGHPIANSDTMQYLAQADHYLSHRSFYEYAGIWGTSDGRLRGDSHGPLWTGFLAQVALWCPQAPGAFFPCARVATTATVISYVAGLLAIARLAPRPCYLALPLLALGFCVPHIWGSAYNGDRDAFRLAALLALIGVLWSHTLARFEGVERPAALVTATLVALFATQGHSLSMLVVPTAVASWAGYIILSTRQWRPAVLLSMAAALGYAVGISQNILALVETASPIGLNVSALDQLAGTIYARGLEARDSERMGAIPDLWARLRHFFISDGGWPSAAAVIATIATAALALNSAVLHRRNRGYAKATDEDRLVTIAKLATIFFASQFALALGILDVGTFKISEWLLLNIRYSMQIYLAAALVVVGVVGIIWNQVDQRRNPFFTTALNLLLFLFIFLPAAVRIYGWYSAPSLGYRNLARHLDEHLSSVPSDCTILADDTGVTLLSKRPVVQLYSRSLREVFQARTAQDVRKLLREKNICAVILYDGLYADRAPSTSPLKQYVSLPGFKRHDILPWKIYVGAP